MQIIDVLHATFVGKQWYYNAKLILSIYHCIILTIFLTKAKKKEKKKTMIMIKKDMTLNIRCSDNS